MSLHRSLFVKLKKSASFISYRFFQANPNPFRLGAFTRSARSGGEMDGSPQGLGWFAEAHNLRGREGQRRLGRGLPHQRGRAAQPQRRAAQVIEDGGELTFKGGPDDEAVLCTDRTTYSVRAWRPAHVLLFQPPGGLPTKVRLPDGTVDDIDADADNPDDAIPISRRCPNAARRTTTRPEPTATDPSTRRRPSTAP